MPIRAICLILGAALLTACGSSSPATPAPSAAAASALAAYTAHGNEETGFIPQDTTIHPTASSFVVGEASSDRANVDIARLEHEGFRGGAIETLGVNSGLQAGGLSAVIALGSPAAAQRELAVELGDAQTAQTAGAIITHFTAPGIPGARGFTSTQPTQGGAWQPAVRRGFVPGHRRRLEQPERPDDAAHPRGDEHLSPHPRRLRVGRRRRQDVTRIGSHTLTSGPVRTA